MIKVLSNISGNYAILLCAGSSERIGNFDKSTVEFQNKPLFFHSVEKFLTIEEIEKIIIVASKKNINSIRKKLNVLSDKNLEKIEIIEGSNERKYSVNNAIKYLSNYEPNNVIIHDSARPHFDINIINNGLELLNKISCVIPLMKIVDTVKNVKGSRILSTLNRDELFYSQTPQFFKYSELKKLLSKYLKTLTYTDEAQLFEKENLKIGTIEGNLLNHKITFEKDLFELGSLSSNFEYTGISTDVHALGQGRELYLAGLKIPSKKGLIGHSDGDVVLHAICDAILGASSNGDLGKHFPSSNAKWKDVSSKIFLNETLNLIKKENKLIKNIDIQIILQKPKLVEYLDAMEENIANLLNINIDDVNVKVTSTDGLGLIGSGEGIGTLCAVNLIKL